MVHESDDTLLVELVFQIWKLTSTAAYVPSSSGVPPESHLYALDMLICGVAYTCVQIA